MLSFSDLSHRHAQLRQVVGNIAIPFGLGKLDGQKNFEDMYKRLDPILACDRQTDGRTSCHGIVRAMHTRRALITRASNYRLFYKYPCVAQSDRTIDWLQYTTALSTRLWTFPHLRQFSNLVISWPASHVRCLSVRLNRYKTSLLDCWRCLRIRNDRI